MCLIVFAWQQSPRFDLILAANRDESHARPTSAAHWWQDPVGMFGGRDRQAGGAWCAAARDGRFAAVTNVREPAARPGRYSRGSLVRDYLAGPASAASWAQQVEAAGSNYSPFNLLLGDAAQLWFVSNRGHTTRCQLAPGIHAVSNGHWGDHWPKTERAQRALRLLIEQGQTKVDSLFDLLADSQQLPHDALPDTGVDPVHEAFLSPIFIVGKRYGTRASTVLRRRSNGQVDFHERGFDSAASRTHRVDDQWLFKSNPKAC